MSFLPFNYQNYLCAFQVPVVTCVVSRCKEARLHQGYCEDHAYDYLGYERYSRDEVDVQSDNDESLAETVYVDPAGHSLMSLYSYVFRVELSAGIVIRVSCYPMEPNTFLLFRPPFLP